MGKYNDYDFFMTFLTTMMFIQLYVSAGNILVKNTSMTAPFGPIKLLKSFTIY
jgi:hypothetical protein